MVVGLAYKKGIKLTIANAIIIVKEQYTVIRGEFYVPSVMSGSCNMILKGAEHGMIAQKQSTTPTNFAPNYRLSPSGRDMQKVHPDSSHMLATLFCCKLL